MANNVEQMPLKFTDLDKKMRVYETAHDHCVLPGIFMVARIDGRCFSTLTKETYDFKAPYDERFRDYMVSTIHHLMNCGFRVLLAYSQSDEINLLFHPEEKSFSRKLRKWNSVLAGEASAKFSLEFGHMATFDCRISQLPNERELYRYFRWRQDDAFRNGLNGHCYWHYRNRGHSDSEAHKLLMGVSNSAKHELLYQEAGLNFNDVASWEKRGFAVYWQNVEKKGVNPKTGEAVLSFKKALKTDFNIPAKDDFESMVRGILKDHS